MISRDADPPESLVGRKITDGKAVYVIDGYQLVSGFREFPEETPLYANLEWFYSADGPELVGD